jgi:hypothetical protein
MFSILWKIIEFAIDKFSDYKLKSSNNEVEKEKIRAETEQSKDKWKAVILTSTGAWWFQLFFIIPLAVWFASVVLYSLLWCKGCAFPQPWSIAALPPPLNEWAGVIIGFLFLANMGKR